MQIQTDRTNRFDEIKTQFRTREGYYRLMNSPDYSHRSQRAMGFSAGTSNSNSSTSNPEKTSIKISLLTINDPNHRGDISVKLSSPNRLASRIPSSNSASRINSRSEAALDTKICFNVGKELFVYNYDGVRNGPDASNPVYKRSYKGSYPTCHDFNQFTANSGNILLLVGFSHGQVQLINLNSCEEAESVKEFNADRTIDKTRVTCVKWIPHSSSLFIVGHASGQLYIYRDGLPCGPLAPVYQLHKRIEGVSVFSCKTKTNRNPVYKWVVGTQADSGDSTIGNPPSATTNVESESCAINEFVFSPCSKYLACVSQDGFLRVYCYDTMELVGRARSYYGGLLCACWSPDGKYVVTGGEDDLITVWSFVERRVVARGIGHRSWVSVVSFDPFYSSSDLRDSEVDNNDDEEDDEDADSIDDERRGDHGLSGNFRASRLNRNTSQDEESITTYRFGSVGQDTQLCFWDLSDDLLKQPIAKNRISSIGPNNGIGNFDCSVISNDLLNLELSIQNQSSVSNAKSEIPSTSNQEVPSKKSSSFTKTFSLVGKRDKRKTLGATNNHNFECSPPGLIEDPNRLLGTPICPRMNEVPLVEPLVCKKISFERLTSLIFCRGGFITSCQDGYVLSWARPYKKSLRLSPSQSNEELQVIDVGTSSIV